MFSIAAMAVCGCSTKTPITRRLSALLGQVKQAVSMRVLGYCLMSNHWHLILWPRHDGDLSRFMLRLTTRTFGDITAHYHHTAGGICIRDGSRISQFRMIRISDCRAVMWRAIH